MYNELVNMTESEIIKMGYAIQKHLEDYQLTDAKPKDLMSILIEKGYFKKDHRDGLPLRNILRKLDENNMLHLLPQLKVVEKK